MLRALENRRLLKKNGDELEEVTDIEERLKDTELIAYFFGGKWCSECVKFVPVLNDFYNKMKERNASFELIYVSSDKSEEEMREFVLDSHGDWFVLYVDESDENGDDFEFVWYFRRSFYVEGIPKLVSVNEKENFIISTKGLTNVLTKGEAAFDEWKTKLEENCDDIYDEETPLEGEIKPNCCKISKFKPWVPTPPIEILADKTLLRKIDNEFKEEPAETVVGDVEIVAFYFSASWCGPCHMFTPELKKCYDEAKAENKSFEVVFVSDDESEEEMKKYMQELHGNWYVIPFDSETFKRSLKNKFHVEGIPTLGIVNRKGKLVDPDGVDAVYSFGPKAFDKWAEDKEEEAQEGQED